MTNYLFEFNIFGGAHNKKLNCVDVFLRKIPHRFRNNLTIGILNRKSNSIWQRHFLSWREHTLGIPYFRASAVNTNPWSNRIYFCNKRWPMWILPGNTMHGQNHADRPLSITNCSNADAFVLLSSLYYKSHQIKKINLPRLVLQMPLPSPLKAGVKSRMKV